MKKIQSLETVENITAENKREVLEKIQVSSCWNKGEQTTFEKTPGLTETMDEISNWTK